MLHQEELFTGKNGILYTLRSPSVVDAEKMIAYLKTTARETEYGLSYPEELDFSVKEEEDFISSYSADEKSIMISAFKGEQLVGNASLSCVFPKNKTLHRAEFGMAILKSEWGQGLGEKILTELIFAAKRTGYKQIELEVAAANSPAIGLYQKLGFQVYGRRPNSLKLKNGNYFDELLMLLELR